jgi:threonine aldolase
MATVAVFSGCVIRAVATETGTLTWKDIEPVIYGRSSFRAATGLIEIENTANLAGGRCTHVDVLEEIWAERERAEAAATLTRGFDTVMFCLSKGLGAPVGSMLTGSAELMDRARLFRKALGGGMRQVGVLAAAGLIALEQGPRRLHEDHANARLLAEALSHMEGVEIDLDAVETNIVIFRLKDGRSAADLVARLKARGILISTVGRDAIRLVTHLDAGRGACVEAAEALTEEIEHSQHCLLSLCFLRPRLRRCMCASVHRRRLLSIRVRLLVPGFVWVGGYHRWDGGRYVWVPGHYDRPPRPHAVWVQHHWVHRHGGWVLVWIIREV